MICSAYDCTKQATKVKLIDGIKSYFCDEHFHLLNYAKTSLIIEVIRSGKLTPKALKRRFNFNSTGFSEQDFDITFQYLLNKNIIQIYNGILMTEDMLSNCSFPGCKLRKIQRLEYCSNHKNMPDLETVFSILESIALLPKNCKQISRELGISSKIVRMTIMQLLKFGYISKEKRGVTNYYYKI